MNPLEEKNVAALVTARVAAKIDGDRAVRDANMACAVAGGMLVGVAAALLGAPAISCAMLPFLALQALSIVRSHRRLREIRAARAASEAKP